ncbi:protein fra10ac1 [Anaeramoeba flamelloides]|uniref:Protein fra10ac1 n=1 Tax=Anaeramoeba flamelloides TaxID=1746091 RepID=A0AAV7ZW45_9EUKA|nr:protein fra10ac1 [Anaeramoeba flamelloides]
MNSEIDPNKVVTDYDLLKRNYQFIPDSKNADTEYQKKLFRDYALVDLRHYDKGKLGVRWRVRNDVLNSKGERVCGNVHCQNCFNLKSYEVNFEYKEQETKKNALIKVTLCKPCSQKLKFYHQQKRKRREEKKQLNLQQSQQILTQKLLIDNLIKSDKKKQKKKKKSKRKHKKSKEKEKEKEKRRRKKKRKKDKKKKRKEEFEKAKLQFKEKKVSSRKRKNYEQQTKHEDEN